MTMISDEPDEDAENLDDEAALETYLGDAPSKPHAGAAAGLPDWPPLAGRGIDLNVEAETLAWFKTTHADWRREMRAVLQSWVAAKAAERESRQPLSSAVPVAEADRDQP